MFYGRKCRLIGLFLWVEFLAAGKSDLRSDATETDVAALLVLILPHADVASDVVCDIFPRTAANDLALHLVRILKSGIIAILRVQI